MDVGNDPTVNAPGDENPMSGDEARSEMRRQDDVTDANYAELKGKFNRQRIVSGLVVFIVMVGAAFVTNFSKKANDTARGAAQFSCLLVQALESQADAEAAIVARLPPGQARDDHAKSREQANDFAAKGRKFVSCPPRVESPKLKK